MPRKYFWFGFSVRDNSHSIASKWMDERCSNKVTIGDREFLSCDRVKIVLQVPRGSICSVDDIDSRRYSLYSSSRLKRYGADESSIDSENRIPWHQLSDYGEPDRVTTVSSGGVVTGAEIEWIDKWRDNYWIVNSGRDSKIRRTRFSLLDTEGNMHYYYAVPWFGPETFCE